MAVRHAVARRAHALLQKYRAVACRISADPHPQTVAERLETMNQTPRPLLAAALLILAAILIMAALRGKDVLHPTLQALIIIIAIIIGFFGVCETVNYLTYILASRVYDVQLARAQTPQRAMIEAYSRLNDNQLKALQGMGRLELLMEPHADTEPLELVRFVVDGQPVDLPRGAVDDFADWGGGYLPSIRGAGSEGSSARRNAIIVTQWLVVHGYADPAEGNLPARWKSEQAYRKAMRSLGYKL